MNKATVLAAVREALLVEFEHFRALSRRTRAASSDGETKAEGKYDTRATEENYLADGQAKQAHLISQAIAAYAALGDRAFAADAPVGLGALVQLDLAGELQWFLLGPAAGGKEVMVEGTTITIITPESPLGRQLLGLKRGASTVSPKAQVREVV